MGKKNGKQKILIIDDEADFTKMVKLNLEQTGKYEVETENLGSRGLAAIKRVKPDLVLLDVFMPRIGGAEIIAQMKEDQSIQDVPVVFLTATVTKAETASQGGLIGGHPFIAKPVSKDELVAFIEQTIG